MKVVVLNAWGNGSTGKIIGEIAKVGLTNGYESYLLYGRGEAPYIDNSLNVNSKMNLYVDVLKSRLFDNQGNNSKKNTKKIINELETYKPDLIHLHNLHGYWVNYPDLFAYIYEKNIPVIWTLHDCWALTGHCAYFEYLNCKNRINGCTNCPGTKEYPKSFIDKAARNLRKKEQTIGKIKKMIIVTPSEWLAQLCVNSYLSKYPIMVINNGIDRSVFQPTDYDYLYDKFGIDRKKKTILYVAMNTRDPWKGFRYILELRNKKIEGCQIVVVGSCNEKSEDGFINIGRTKDQHELAAFYSLADVLVNPSLDDNYPTVNLEALACGLPIVAFNTGGIPEQISKDTGYICKQKSSEELLRGINVILKFDKKEICRKCTERFEAISDVDFATKYIDIYRNLIKS